MGWAWFWRVVFLAIIVGALYAWQTDTLDDAAFYIGGFVFTLAVPVFCIITLINAFRD